MGSCSSSPPIIPVDDITISIFGLDNAGKTCLLRSLAGNFDFESVPTIGLGQESFVYKDDTKLTVYDLGGSSKFRSVWTRFFAEIWGFIYVIDASDPERFQESKETLDKMLEHKMIKKKPYIIVANKQDKEGAIPAAELKTRLKIGRKVEVYDAVVTSSTEEHMNEGVSKAIDSLVDSIVKNFESISKRRILDLEEQKTIEEQEHKAKLARIQARKEQQEKEAQETAKQSENIEKESKQVNENDEKSKSSSSAGE